MNNPKKKIALALAALAVLAVVAFPAPIGRVLYDGNRAAEAWAAGLEEAQVVVDGVRWTYYGRNLDAPGTCALLVHGFTAEASNWFRFARHLDDRTCLLVPDLPGFGRSEYRDDLAFDVPSQTARLWAFVRAVRPQGRLHLVGSSMGGHIVLLLALDHPERAASLASIDGGGVRSPQPSEASTRYAATGRSAFDLRSRDEFGPFLATAMADPPWMPWVVKVHLADEFMARNARYMAIWRQVYGRDRLDARLGELRLPTLVLWGARDRLLHVSMAEVLHRGIAGSQKVVMQRLGHLPFLEDPEPTARIYERFRERASAEGARPRSENGISVP